MSTLSLRLPDSLHAKVRELAERDDISINQFVAMAVAEKMSALLTLDYIEKRGKRGTGAHLRAALRRVPDVPAAPGDEWRSDDDAVPAKALSRPPQRRRRQRATKRARSR